MQQEIIFSGFGGQGALFAGQVLAYAAMDHGLNVTWIPSFMFLVSSFLSQTNSQ